MYTCTHVDDTFGMIMICQHTVFYCLLTYAVVFITLSSDIASAVTSIHIYW